MFSFFEFLEKENKRRMLSIGFDDGLILIS